jgi:RNA polymerase sigma-70 factor, ECF subfamily
VLRYLRRLTRNEAEAEDLLQETLVDAFTHAASWRGDGSRRAWLLGIARHRVLHARRGALAAHQVAMDETERPLEVLGVEAGWGAPVDPETLTVQLEERSLLEHALSALEPTSREVLTLRELEGLSGDETAQVLGLSLAAMKSRLHRARLELVAQVKRELKTRVEVAHG